MFEGVQAAVSPSPGREKEICSVWNVGPGTGDGTSAELSSDPVSSLGDCTPHQVRPADRLTVDTQFFRNRAGAAMADFDLLRQTMQYLSSSEFARSVTPILGLTIHGDEELVLSCFRALPQPNRARPRRQLQWGRSRGWVHFERAVFSSNSAEPLFCCAIRVAHSPSNPRV